MRMVAENSHRRIPGRTEETPAAARRPRAGLVTPHSGCAGAPPGVTRDPREELADGGPFNGLSEVTEATARG